MKTEALTLSVTTFHHNKDANVKIEKENFQAEFTASEITSLAFISIIIPLRYRQRRLRSKKYAIFLSSYFNDVFKSSDGL